METEFEVNGRWKLIIGEYPRLQQYLFGGASFPLDDCLCCLVVLVRHGAGKGGHSLTVTDVEANVRVGNEELYDDAVLVADGNVDGCSAFRILAEDKGKKKGLKRTPLEPIIVHRRSQRGKAASVQQAGLQRMETDFQTAKNLAWSISNGAVDSQGRTPDLTLPLRVL